MSFKVLDLSSRSPKTLLPLPTLKLNSHSLLYYIISQSLNALLWSQTTVLDLSSSSCSSSNIQCPKNIHCVTQELISFRKPSVTALRADSGIYLCSHRHVFLYLGHWTVVIANSLFIQGLLLKVLSLTCYPWTYYYCKWPHNKSVRWWVFSINHSATPNCLVEFIVTLSTVELSMRVKIK